MSQRRIWRAEDEIRSDIESFLASGPFWIRQLKNQPGHKGRAFRRHGISLLGEGFTISAVRDETEPDVLVEYVSTLRPVFAMLVGSCLLLFGASLAIGSAITLSLPLWPEHPFGPALDARTLAAFRFPLLISALLSYLAFRGLQWISKSTEDLFWKAVKFDAKRDRTCTGSLRAEGNPLLGRLGTAVLLNSIIGAAFFIFELPRYLFLVSVLLTIVQVARFSFASNSMRLRRAELAWTLGFRDSSYAYLILIAHIFLFWISALCGHAVESAVLNIWARAASNGTESARVQFLPQGFFKALDIRSGAEALLPLATSEYRAFGLPAPPTPTTFGPSVTAILTNHLQLVGEGSARLLSMLGVIGLLMIVLLLAQPYLLLRSSLKDTREWQSQFGRPTGAGEYLLAVEYSRQSSGAGEVWFWFWLIVVWLVGLVLRSLAVIVAIEVLAHAIFNVDVPGLENIWIPYSLMQELSSHAGVSSSLFHFVLFAFMGPLFLFPGIVTALWVTRRSAIWLAARNPKGSLLECDGVRIIEAPPWLRAPQLSWNRGPCLLTPSRMFKRLAQYREQGGRALEAVVAHEKWHFSGYPRRSFLSWLGAATIGNPGYSWLFEDPIAEERAADAAAIEAAGSEALREAIHTIGHRGLRRRSRLRRLALEFPELTEAAKFHFLQGALGYSHPVPAARLAAMENENTEKVKHPKTPRGTSVLMAQVGGLILGVGALLTISLCGYTWLRSKSGQQANSGNAPRAIAHLGYIIDLADVLTGDEEVQLESSLAELEARTCHQIGVLTIPNLGSESIESFSLRVARAWGLGCKGINNCILLTVVPEERQARIELGMGFEGRIPDRRTEEILEHDLIPSARAGHFSEGIEATVDSLSVEASAWKLPKSECEAVPKAKNLRKKLVVEALLSDRWTD